MASEKVLTAGGEIDLQPLISKLGHDVEEIRVRSLKNISFKLDHDLICVGDVVHKREIFIKLLEWFNLEPCAHQKEVLQLLHKLSKHPSGLETLLNIGGVEFLTQLRKDVEPSLYEVVDSVLNNLMSLTELPGPDDDNDNLLQQHLHYERGTSDPAILASRRSVNSESPSGQESSSSSANAGYNNPECSAGKPLFVDNSNNEVTHAVDDYNREVPAMWTFPWIGLAYSDRHILATTNSRLQSHNSNLVEKSCEFLNDVLFKDFPSEIFLQRPSIVMTLLTLLELKTPENSALSLSAARCLSNLCVHLRQRYLLVSDPAWYSLQPNCWKHWLNAGSSSSSPSPVSELSDLRTTGDGEEKSSESSSKTESENTVEMEEEDSLVREALEMNQMTLGEFGLQVLRGCCPLLNAGQPLLVDPLPILAALQHAMNLLRECCSRNQWWNSNKMKPLRRDICSITANILDTHMVRCGLKPTDDGHDIVEHNVTRHAMTVVTVAFWVIKFLGPFLHTDWDEEGSLQDLGEVFQQLVMNEMLFTTHPEIRRSLERCPFLTEDASFKEMYQRALDVKTSLVSSVEFLKKVKGSNTKQDRLIELLGLCLLSLPYHHHLDLVTRAIRVISQVFQVSSSNARSTRAKAKEILLALLSNNDDDVRQKSYESCIEVVKDALKLSHVTNPMANHCSKALFVIDRDVLYTICAFGMTDQKEEIAELAVTILETLLNHRLNMSGQVWKKLMDDLLTSLPFLQMHLGKRTKLAACLNGLLAPPGESHHSLTADGEVVPFSQFERLRGSLRCMFLKDKTTRTKGYQYLIRQLVHEDSKLNRDFVYPSGRLENSSDLFLIETFLTSVRSHRSTKHANFDEDKIRTLLDIVLADNNEVSLRKASAEQLAVIMQDPQWHNVLLEDMVEDTLVKILEECLVKDGKVLISSTVNPKLELVSPCLKILRLLSDFNVRCRHKLAQNSALYYLVARHALLAPSGGTVRYEAACILTLLLFDEVALQPNHEERETEEEGDINFALPAIFLKKYSLPFNPPICEQTNPYERDKPPSPDPLRSEPGLSLIRVAWNMAWAEQDPSKVAAQLSESVHCDNLMWTPVDSQLLKSCSAELAVPGVFSSIQTATSHHAVKMSVRMLTLHLVAENIVNDNKHSVSARELFYSCDWKTAFERYFRVYPKTSDDDLLLGEVIRMFRHLIESRDPQPASFLGWLGHVIMMPQTSVGNLVSSGPSREQSGDVVVSESKRLLRIQLLEFLTIFVRKLHWLAKPWLWCGEMIYAGDFTLTLTLNLTLTDSPQYYDLPILESTLQCLVEITSIPGFSTASKLVEPRKLCAELLSSLLQVLTAFHAGRLEAFTSFMGRGVTVCVSLCLAHLVHEVSSVLKLEDWPSLFLTATDSGNTPDLSWLPTMWTDHLPEVRWCSLLAATHIVAKTRSPLSIRQAIPGGLWNLAVIILLDSRECCLVRDQAALLLSTLVSTLVVNGNPQESGLSVQTENEIISGRPALHMLLTHHQFYASFTQLLCNVVFENSPQLPGTTTFAARSLSSASSNRSRTYGIPYQSLDTDSQGRSELGRDRSASESTRVTSSSRSTSPSADSAKRLLEESPLTSSVENSLTVSSQASSTVPLITSRKRGTQQDGNDVPSTPSTATVDSLEILAWSTPRFVGSLSCLVANLVCLAPETVLSEVKYANILGLFMSYLDAKHAISLMNQLGDSRLRGRHLEINLVDTLDMYKNIALLVKTCTEKDPVIAHALQQNSAILENVIGLLFIRTSQLSDCVQRSCAQMKRSVLGSLLVTLKSGNESCLLETPLEQLVMNKWTDFSAAFNYTMLGSDSALRTAYVHFLSHVFLREAKRVTSQPSSTSSLSRILDTALTMESNDVITTIASSEIRSDNNGLVSGSVICSVFLEEYSKETMKDVLLAALRNLFCISQCAKKTAIKAGFLGISLDKIKRLHVQLNLESLEVGKGNAVRKKEMELILEIAKILELLKNLLYRSEETKLEALKCGITCVLQQLWSWCAVNTTLRLAVLELLCTLTARCTQASVTMSNTSAGFGSSVRMGPSNNTFVHCIIKMTLKMFNKTLTNSSGEGNTASCQMLFALLKNLAMTAECRGILFKSNFLFEFSRLKSISHQKWKAGHKILVALWLELLANIAFYRDGQQMIIKIENVIPLVLQFGDSPIRRVGESAMLVLRNLCFHVPSKTLLLSNSELVELLLKNVSKQSIYIRSLAASALWALLTNNQKAKSILGKPLLVVKRLSDAKHMLKPAVQGAELNDGSDELHRQLYENAVDNILKILR